MTYVFPSPEGYRVWLHRRPSCLSGAYTKRLDGALRCIASAVIVPAGFDELLGGYARVPLTEQEVAYRQSHGLSAYFRKFYAADHDQPPIYPVPPQDDTHIVRWFALQAVRHSVSYCLRE